MRTASLRLGAAARGSLRWGRRCRSRPWRLLRPAPAGQRDRPHPGARAPPRSPGPSRGGRAERIAGRWCRSSSTRAPASTRTSWMPSERSILPRSSSPLSKPSSMPGSPPRSLRQGPRCELPDRRRGPRAARGPGLPQRGSGDPGTLRGPAGGRRGSGLRRGPRVRRSRVVTRRSITALRALAILSELSPMGRWRGAGPHRLAA